MSETQDKSETEFPTLYTVEEAAKLVRLAPMTMWMHLNSGALMRTKVGGRTFIRASELQKLIRDLPLGPTEVRRGNRIGKEKQRGSKDKRIRLARDEAASKTEREVTLKRAPDVNKTFVTPRAHE